MGNNRNSLLLFYVNCVVVAVISVAFQYEVLEMGHRYCVGHPG